MMICNYVILVMTMCGLHSKINGCHSYVFTVDKCLVKYSLLNVNALFVYSEHDDIRILYMDCTK